jgi:hypothetical protein
MILAGAIMAQIALAHASVAARSPLPQNIYQPARVLNGFPLAIASQDCDMA